MSRLRLMQSGATKQKEVDRGIDAESEPREQLKTYRRTSEQGRVRANACMATSEWHDKTEKGVIVTRI